MYGKYSCPYCTQEYLKGQLSKKFGMVPTTEQNNGGKATSQPSSQSDGSAIATNDDTPFVNEDQTASGGETVPTDKYSLVYYIFLLHGIGVLLPWNTFLTIADKYFLNYKLANAAGTEYYINFFSYLTACSQVPNLLLNLINLFIVVKGSGLGRRISISLFLVSLICIFTIVMIFVESESWPFGFFLLTMFSVILLNSANGVYQNSIYGLCADFPFHFTNAVILGNNLCGIFIAVLAILTILFSNSTKWAAFLYFGISFLTVLACIASFSLLPRFAFYRYYTRKAAKARKENVDGVLLSSETAAAGENGITTNLVAKPEESQDELSLASYVSVFKEVWRHMLDIFLVFFVTLALFPTVLVRVKLYPPSREHDFFIPEHLYLPIMVFLNFNVFAFVGNVIANYVQWPSPKHLNFVVIPRLLFIPLFWYCNYVPGGTRAAPVLIQNEWAYVILIIIMSLSHGYYSSLSMMYAPKAVHSSKARVVGMMSAFMLVFGITMGVLFTFVESWLFTT